MKGYLNKIAATLITCVIFFAPGFSYTDDDRSTVNENTNIEDPSLQNDTNSQEEGESELPIWGDLSQYYQFYFQDQHQKTGQAYNMISNVMKTYHDTQKSFIENMR